MGLHALLTVDLPGADTTARTEFNAQLKAEFWRKRPNLTTTWTAKFEEAVSEESVLRITRNDVAKAAKIARISSYNAAVAVSSAEPTMFSL